MVFRGVNHADPPTIISWPELKNGHENGEFHSFVNRTLSKVLRNAKKLVLVTHGFKDGDIGNCQKTWVSDLANKIRTFENEGPKLEHQVPTATVAVCWNSHPTPTFPRVRGAAPNLCYLSSKLLKWFYYQPALSTGKMGELLAKLIKAMKDVFSNIEYVHGIGHSLGAHVMGNIYNFGGIKLDRLSGLDPAGPCFEGVVQIVGHKWGVTENSAFFVDNIHTNGDLYGTYQSKGHLDFITGDPEDPTCSKLPIAAMSCHSLAIEYFTESINLDEYPRFKTSYLTKSQDETSISGRTIGPAESSQVYFAGYHASTSSSIPTPNKNRMFLPVFEVNGKWQPICDQNIQGENKRLCDNQE